MISLVKVIIEHFSKLLGKRGELRNKDILLTPQLSSSYRVLKYLSSPILLLKKLVNYSHILFRVSMDPRVKPEGDRKESVPEGGEKWKNVSEGDRKESVSEGDERRKSVPEGDRKESVFEGGGRWKNVSEGDNLYKVMPRLGTNRPGIFELGKNRIGRSLDVFWRKRGMTLLVGIFSLFLLFPNVSNSAVYFLPDAQWDIQLKKVGIATDSIYCEDAGYTYYSSGTCPAYHKQDTCIFSDKYLKCDATGWCRENGYTLSSCPNPKTLTTRCPNNLSLYKSCVCPSTYKYACTGTGYSSGNGTVCESKYTKCNCSTNYVWSGSACVCDSAFKYTCSGTGYSSGSGASCGGKYKSCNCSTYYSWNGSACAHVHSYVCPSGYTASSAGMISPTSKAKVCALSGCSSTSGTCYKETHSHSYSCTSGYSSSCSYGYRGTASKRCSCGATSGTCYYCKSYCEAYPCGSGCYTDLSCSYGCASYNSCGGCQRCESAPACTSSSSNYCWVHDSCHGDCCTDGTIQPCDTRCGGSGCSTSSSSSSSGGSSSSSSSSSSGSSSSSSSSSTGGAVVDPCAGVSCPTAASCDYGCASYSTATDCCSSVCTSCNSAPTPDPDPVDPCASVTCPTAKSCTYGCASTSTATSCCASVCTSCKQKCEADPCASGCYNNVVCSSTCKRYNSCGGCEECNPDCSSYIAGLIAQCGGCPAPEGMIAQQNCCANVDYKLQECLNGG